MALSDRERPRRAAQSWKSRGFTQIPNVLLSNALPAGVRATASAIYARGFGKQQGVCLRADTIAKDVGFSRQTVQKHLNVLELAGIIKRIRRGRGLANVIVLCLKGADKLCESIKRALPFLSGTLFEGQKRTMLWWMERWKVHRQAMKALAGGSA